MEALLKIAQHIEFLRQTFEKMDGPVIEEFCKRLQATHDIKSVRRVLGVRKWHSTVSGASPYDWRNYAISRLLLSKRRAGAFVLCIANLCAEGTPHGLELAKTLQLMSKLGEEEAMIGLKQVVEVAADDSEA